MFSFSSKQGNILKWLNFIHTALSIQINFYSRLKSHACFPRIITKLEHLLQRLALFLHEGFKPTSAQIFLLVSTLAFIVKETKQKLFSSSQRTAHLAFGALPLTSGHLSSWNPAWWNVLCLGNFWKRPRNKFVPMDACFMKTGMRSRWRCVLYSQLFLLKRNCYIRGDICRLKNSPHSHSSVVESLLVRFSHCSLTTKHQQQTSERELFNKSVTGFPNCVRMYSSEITATII